MNKEYAEIDPQKADMLNKFFAFQMDQDYNYRPLPHFPPNDHTLMYSVITVEGVKNFLRNLYINKACGPDLISPCLLKEGATIIALPLSIIFNRSLEQGYVPTCWKYGSVTPIYKKNDKSQPSNYRPITLLSSLGKARERCGQKYLHNYIKDHQILTQFQSGFVSGNSTTNQLLHKYHTFCNAVDVAKKSGQFFVISVRHSTECGTGVSFTN